MMLITLNYLDGSKKLLTFRKFLFLKKFEIILYTIYAKKVRFNGNQKKQNKKSK